MDSLLFDITSLFHLLLGTTMHASVIVCIVITAKALLSKRLAPRWHYYLWLLVIARMLMPSAPQSALSIFNLVPSLTQSQTTVDQLATPTAGDTTKHYQQTPTNYSAIEHPTKGKETTNSLARKGQLPSQSDTTEHSAIEQQIATQPLQTITQTPPAAAAPVKHQIDYIALLPLVWLIGVIALALYVFLGNIRLWSIVRQKRPVTDSSILNLLEDCKSQMKLHTYLSVVETGKVSSPALFGFIRPRLLLPVGLLEKLTPTQLRHVFLHELAHLKRGDIYLGWLTALLQTLHWFNPIIWFAFHKMRADRELACDQLALTSIQDEEPNEYGKTIVRLLENFSAPTYNPGLAGILEDRSQLKRRITMIAKHKKGSYRFSTLAAIVMIFLSAIALTNAKDTTPPEEKKAIANAFVDLLINENFKEATQDFDKTMSKALPANRLAKIWKETTAQAGPFQEKLGTRSEKYLRSDIIYITCQFENGPLDIKVVYNRNKKITGLWFTPVPQKVLDEYANQKETTEDTTASIESYVTTLGNGVKVELLGVCEYPSNNRQWWNTKGEFIDQVPYDQSPAKAFPKDGQIARELAVRLNGDNAAINDAHVRWDIPDSSSSSGTVEKGGQQLFDVRGVTFLVNAKRKKLDFKVGVAAGKWTTLFTHNGSETMSSGSEGHGIAFSRASQINKNIEITVSDDYFGIDYRLIAVGKDDNVHTTKNRSSNSGGKVRQSIFKFINLNLEDIKEFQFQTRPYEFVTFEKVSLKPKSTTDAAMQEKSHIPSTSIINATGRIEDKIDYPFINDPNVIGNWKSVDFVQNIENFDPTEKNWKGNLYLKNLNFQENGKLKGNFWTWTKGLTMHKGDKTASKYIIKNIDGSDYMFYEWKSGDYTIRHSKPCYYVLTRVLVESIQNEPMIGKKAFIPPTSTINKDGLIEDKIDYPFVCDPDVIGGWKSVDFIGNIDDFDPTEKNWKGELFLNCFIFQENGDIKGNFLTWTKGLVISPHSKTASKYVIKTIDGCDYMFYEWKSGDYTIRHSKPSYYVLTRVLVESIQNEPMIGKKAFIPPTSTINKDGRIIDKVDYPFVDDPQVIGKWISVDFVKEISEFNPAKKNWDGELFLAVKIFHKGGKVESILNKDQGQITCTDRWTKGLDLDEDTASKYIIKKIDGVEYMFSEWKSGDYRFRHQKPSYYVLKKATPEKVKDETPIQNINNKNTASTEVKAKNLVEDFFKHNYRDITARKTLEWSKTKVDEDGNISIRYKFEATIWGKDKIIENKVWTFDKNGKYISVTKVEKVTTKNNPPTAKKRYFVTIVAGSDGERIGYDGEQLGWGELGEMLANLSDKNNTVLEVAYMPGVIPNFPNSSDRNKWLNKNEAFTKAGQLVRELGLEYLSFVGQDNPSSRRAPVSIRTEGKLKLNKEISLKLQSFEQAPLLNISKIEFTRYNGKLTAKLKLGVTSYPHKFWEIGVRLLDEKGHQIDSVLKNYENSGFIRRIALRTTGLMEFEFGQADLRAIGRFEVKLREIIKSKNNANPVIPLEFDVRTDFLDGDSIEITEILGTSSKIEPGHTYTVTGKYKLTSHDSAMLHLYATNGETSSKQGPVVNKGQGGFTRTFTFIKNGGVHLSFYPAKGGSCFGGIYFNHKD